MTKGTIVLTPFPFTDLSSAKIRPAVVATRSRKLGDDDIVAFISSKIIESILETEYLLTKIDVPQETKMLRISDS